MADKNPIVGVVLAGGHARRLGGGDKPLREIGGQSMLARIIRRLSPQCDELLLNANGDPARFAPYGLPVIADAVEGYPGPLAGILAGLEWTAANRPAVRWVLTAAADSPFLPPDLAARLSAAAAAPGIDVAVAASGGRSHHVIALWRVDLRVPLRAALTADGSRAVGRWISAYNVATVTWPTEPFDPFFNANTPDDLDEACRLAARHGG